MCKHDWKLLLPLAKEIEESKRMNYVVDVMLSCVGKDYYCPLCKRTAHVIKSWRGGMRLHHSNWMIQQANKIRANYGLPALELNEKFETSF